MTEQEYDALVIECSKLAEDLAEMKELDAFVFKPYQVTIDLIQRRIDEINALLAEN